MHDGMSAPLPLQDELPLLLRVDYYNEPSLSAGNKSSRFQNREISFTVLLALTLPTTTVMPTPHNVRWGILGELPISVMQNRFNTIANKIDSHWYDR